ncbi:MAG: response regulator [Chitinophagaceae bacterium]|nr:response regulator [Chitinophagaceae bacterium]
MKRILHLDDDEEIITILEYVLGKSYTLRSIMEPDLAMDELQRFQPDLVLTDNFEDFLKPDSGFLRFARSKHVPVVLFSAAPDIQERAQQLGINGFIEKPAAINHIREYVAKMLQ